MNNECTDEPIGFHPQSAVALMYIVRMYSIGWVGIAYEKPVKY
jgi:hypothetical protein